MERWQPLKANGRLSKRSSSASRRLESRFEQDGYLHQMAQALDKPVIHLQEEFARIEKRISKTSSVWSAFLRTTSPAWPPSQAMQHVRTIWPNRPIRCRQRCFRRRKSSFASCSRRGSSMVELVLSNMSMDEFSPGLVRSAVEAIIAAYKDGKISADPFIEGRHGELLRDLVVRIMMDRHEPSENWLRLKNIEVPRFNGDPYEAAASAMTLLKLDRIDESVRRALGEQRRTEQAGGDVRPILEEIMALKRLRAQIARREYLDWNES
jgi:hypothetical protein